MYVCEKHDTVLDLYLGIAIPGYQTFQEGRQQKHLSWGQERKKEGIVQEICRLYGAVHEHHAPNWAPGL